MNTPITDKATMTPNEQYRTASAVCRASDMERLERRFNELKKFASDQLSYYNATPREWSHLDSI